MTRFEHSTHGHKLYHLVYRPGKAAFLPWARARSLFGCGRALDGHAFTYPRAHLGRDMSPARLRSARHGGFRRPVHDHRQRETRIIELPHGLEQRAKRVLTAPIMPANATSLVTRQRIVDFLKNASITTRALEQMSKAVEHFTSVGNPYRVARIPAPPL